jgi:hypothetical protein
MRLAGSSVTEEHGALRHILCRGPFSATFGPYLKNFFGPSGTPNSRGPLVIALTLPYVRYATA